MLAWCAQRGVAVVPQGGNTGLVGGSVPLEDEVVLSTVRLSSLGPVDEVAAQVTVGAGATLAAVQQTAAAAGFEYAIDLGARDTATIGGTIATNAGGLHVLAHGSTRAQVVGIEAALTDGSQISRLGGLLKDNTGYDLAGSLCGSEGTLAVVTAARLRLLPRRPEHVVAALGFRSSQAAVGAIADLRAVRSLVAAELVWRPGLELALAAGVPPPFEPLPEVLVVVECAATVDPLSEVAAAVTSLAAVEGVAVAADGPGRTRLWALRERQTELIARVGVPHKLDVTLPLAGLAAFADDVGDLIAGLRPDASTWLFGHGGDGNLHVNITGLAPDDDEVDDAVLHMVAARGGSISAEHGIGRAKARWLHLARSPAELDVFARIRRAWDPAGILNPGVLAAAATG